MGDREDELLDFEEEDAEHEQAGKGAEAAGDKKNGQRQLRVSVFTCLAFGTFFSSPSCSEPLNRTVALNIPTEGELIK